VEYNGFVVPDLAVSILDDDVAGVALSSADGAGGNSARCSYNNFGDSLEAGTYTVALTSQPLSDVVVSLAGLSSYAVATPNTLTITQAAWATPVTVSVACSAASNDRPLCADGTRFCAATASSAVTLRSEGPVTHAVTSADPTYNAIAAPAMTDVVADIVYDNADPPVALDARFGDPLNFITVAFDIPTDRASLSGSFDCTTVFDLTAAEANTLLGGGAACSFSSTSTLRVCCVCVLFF
jgi:hypothetical protein